MSERWEKERASWVLARAGHRAGARRRGEKLMVTARRGDRYEAGAGDATFAEVTTRPLLYRSIFREEGAANTMGWAALTLTWTVATVFLVGPALLISRIAYGLWWSMVPRWGRMSAGPYLGIAAVLGCTAWLAFLRFDLDGSKGLMAYYIAFQLVGGIAWAAWLVRANGWAAVARKKKQTGSRIAPIQIEVDASEVPAETQERPRPRVDAPVEVEIAPIVIDDEDEPETSHS